MSGVHKSSPCPAILSAETTGNDVLHLAVRLSNGTRHLDSFIRWRCAADLLALEVFPNAKEITESMAAWSAITYRLKVSPADRDVTVLCVGDGCTPRTGALLAFKSRWTAWSVDPRLRWAACDPEDGPLSARHEKPGKVRRLGIAPVRVEDFTARLSGRVVIAAVHSHARLMDAVEVAKRNGAESVAVVANPCCVEQSIDRSPDEVYQDWNVWSAQREIRIWRRA